MTLYGIDESKYQGTLDGQDFTIIRATAGNSYVDPTCDAKYQQNKRDGKLLGVYHYAYPALNDPISEAEWFAANSQGYLGEAIPVVDAETSTNVAWFKQFLDHFYSLTQVWPMIYMSASAVNAADWSSVSGHDALWEAGYPSVFNVPNPPTPNASGSDMPYASGSWAFATIWQYTSSAGTLDKDVGYLTPDAWHKIAEGDRNATPPVETPTPVTTPVEATPVDTGGSTSGTGQDDSGQPTSDTPPVVTVPPTTTPVVSKPKPKPTIVTTVSPLTKLDEVVIKAFHTFWQSFVSVFAVSATGLASSLLSVHNFSDGKSFTVAAASAIGAAILSAVKNVIVIKEN